MPSPSRSLFPAPPPPTQAYNLANDLAARAQATWLYSKAKQNLLPLAQPAVDTGEGCAGQLSRCGGAGALGLWLVMALPR